MRSAAVKNWLNRCDATRREARRYGAKWHAALRRAA